MYNLQTISRPESKQITLTGLPLPGSLLTNLRTRILPQELKAFAAGRSWHG
jgi:hypothetical protein